MANPTLPDLPFPQRGERTRKNREKAERRKNKRKK